MFFIAQLFFVYLPIVRENHPTSISWISSYKYESSISGGGGGDIGHVSALPSWRQVFTWGKLDLCLLCIAYNNKFYSTFYSKPHIKYIDYKLHLSFGHLLPLKKATCSAGTSTPPAYPFCPHSISTKNRVMVKPMLFGTIFIIFNVNVYCLYRQEQYIFSCICKKKNN